VCVSTPDVCLCVSPKGNCSNKPNASSWSFSEDPNNIVLCIGIYTRINTNRQTTPSLFDSKIGLLAFFPSFIHTTKRSSAKNLKKRITKNIENCASNTATNCLTVLLGGLLRSVSLMAAARAWRCRGVISCRNFTIFSYAPGQSAKNKQI
jgi:hypothetical protein